MSDPHFNIFHAYRGSTRSEAAVIRQLEDNVTRALAITLNALQESSLRFPVLRQLGFSETEMESQYQVQLQVGKEDPDWPKRERRRLLVIHGGPKVEILAGTEFGETGRADAVIATSRSLVAIESKLDSQVLRGQLKRHRETLGIPETGLVETTWSDLARAIRATSRDQRSQPVARFVLDQFEEYLRMNGFGGLSHEHFAYFALLAEQRSPLVKDGIRRALEEIGDSLLPLFGSGWHRHVLTIRQDDPITGVVIKPQGRARNPHVTISIEPDGLNIQANIELQRPYERFRAALRSQPSQLVGLLRDLGTIPVQGPEDNPWRLCVMRRVSLGRPRAYHYYPAVDVTTNVMVEWSDHEVQWFIDQATRKPENEAAPQIFIKKSYSVPQVLARESMVDELSRDIDLLEPFFEWIGQPIC